MRETTNSGKGELLVRKSKRLRREFFKIDRVTRKYDRKTHTFTFNIAYRTATLITPRTIAVAEAFGLGVDEEREFPVLDCELKIKPKDIVYITGDSGSGKSTLLKAVERDLSEVSKTNTTNISDILVEKDKPLIDTVGETFEQGLELLSRVGLNDAFLFIRKYDELSDGQKYRYRLAKLIGSGAKYWIADEFCSTLDRDTAKIVAFNFQKLARKMKKAIIVATTHTDLFEDLNPSVHVHKRFGKEIHVNYYKNVAQQICSITKTVRTEEGTHQDWDKLKVFHYRGKRPPPPRKIFRMMRGDEVVGVIVYSYAGARCFGRKQAFGYTPSVNEINRDLSVISRVVVHPKYRTVGLGKRLVRDTLPNSPTPIVEMIAVMAQYNPFAEKAGMKKIAEKTPPKSCVRTIERLRELGFDPVLMASEKYNMRIIRLLLQKSYDNIETIREVLMNTHHSRLGKEFDSHRPFISAAEYREGVKKTSLQKLAKLIQVIALLAQKKVYLFWRKPKA